MLRTGNSRAGPDPPEPRHRRPRFDPGLAVPPCALALLQLSERPELLAFRDYFTQNPGRGLTAAGCLTAAGFCIWGGGRTLQTMIAPYARMQVGRVNPQRARIEFPYYPELILVHTGMLAMSPGELASRVGIPWTVAWYIQHTPSFIPEPQTLQRICDAMMVPLEWLRRRGGYGEELTIARLSRYHSLGLADAWTWQAIMHANHRTRAGALVAIERRLLADDLTREGGRHA